MKIRKYKKKRIRKEKKRKGINKKKKKKEKQNLSKISIKLYNSVIFAKMKIRNYNLAVFLCI